MNHNLYSTTIMNTTPNKILFEIDEPVTIVTAGNFGPGGMKLRSISVEQGLMGKIIRFVKKGERKEKVYSLDKSKGFQIVYGHPRLTSILKDLDFLSGESSELSPMEQVKSLTKNETVLFEWWPMESY